MLCPNSDNGSFSDLFPGAYDQRAFWAARKSELRQRGTPPRWLANAESDPEGFLKRDLFSKQFLKDSLFYACAGDDGQPLREWSGLVHSYIYMDSCYNDNWLMMGLRPRNLRGYHCFYEAEVPLLGPQEIEDIWNEMEIDLDNSANPRRAEGSDRRGWVGEKLSDEFRRDSSRAWVYLFRRRRGFGPSHGPRLLSLCLISGGATTHYYHFYNRNGIVPEVLCTTNPGMCDWIGICHDDGIFHDVLKLNRAGMPPLNLGRPFYREYSIALYEEPEWSVPSLWLNTAARPPKWISPLVAKLHNSDLILASEMGDLEACKKLLAAGENVNNFDARGWTPLMGAAANSHFDICRLLIRHGAEVNAVTKRGRTALMEAARAASASVCRILLEAGADVNLSDNEGSTALMRAVWRRGQTSCTEILLRAGADPNARNMAGETPILIAAARGGSENCEMLLNAGADIESKTWSGWTPLCLAAKVRDKYAVKLLVERGADLFFKDREGRGLYRIASDVPRNGRIAHYLLCKQWEKEEKNE